MAAIAISMEALPPVVILQLDFGLPPGFPLPPPEGPAAAADTVAVALGQLCCPAVGRGHDGAGVVAPYPPGSAGEVAQFGGCVLEDALQELATAVATA